MPRVPPEILELARSHHRQLFALEAEARRRVRDELDRAVRRIETDRTFRSFSDFRSLQLSQIEILARLSRAATTEGLESALEDILDEGLLLAPTHAEAELRRWLDFYGAEARPLNLAALAAASRDTLIERIPESLATWGPDIARRVRKELSAGIATMAGRDEVLQGIQGAIGAERWKADRIFRTELFDAYNEAHLDALGVAQDAYGIDVKKSAIVTFDARTADDSRPMHGQVRELDENFVDGEGRRFLHPPGRPNDREKEIPWLEDAPPEIISLEEGDARIEADVARRREVQERSRARRGLPPLGPRARRRPATYEERREAIILGWVNSSNSNSAIATKKAALDEFGLDGQVWNPRGRTIPENVDQRRADLRRMYDEAQEFYQGERVGTVRLYRGVKTDTIVEGSVEAWTSNPEIARRFAGPGGKVIVADIDTRRILSSVDTPGWTNGRFGNQSEYLILSDNPELRFDLGDWQSGPFRAGDLDPDALSAGQWGVLQDSRGRARLEHLPSGRTFLEGEAYTRDGLLEAAQYLDRTGYFDGLGRITPAGVDELADAIDVLRVRYGGAIPVGEDAAEGIELFGTRWGLVNQELKPGTAGKWSRRTITVTRDGPEGYYYRDFRGVIQENLGIITDPEGSGNGSFTLVHLPTGRELFQGVRTFYSEGFRVPFDFGGFQQAHLRELGERLHEFLDETGAVRPDRLDDWNKLFGTIAPDPDDFDPRIHATWQATRPGETPEEWVDGVFSILDDDDDDELDDFDFFFELGRKQRTTGGPSPGFAKRARDSHRPTTEPELSDEERFEDAVRRRMEELRRGRYNRHKDPDMDRAIQAEAARRRAEEEKARVEKARKRQELGFDVGDGRQREAELEADAARRRAAAQRKALEEAERERLEAEEERELAEREAAAKELEARRREEEERAQEEAERARREAEEKAKAEEEARRKAEEERRRLEEEELREREAAAREAAELAEKKRREEEKRKAARREAELEAGNFGIQFGADDTAEDIREKIRVAQEELERQAAEEAAARAAAAARVPKFQKTADAQTWAKDNVAERVKLKRTYKVEGVQEAMEAIDDMNDRFDMPQLYALTDQAHFNREYAQDFGNRFSGAGPRHVTAAYGQGNGGVLLVKKQSFDAEHIAEVMGDANEFYARITPMEDIVRDLKLRDKDEAAAALEWLVDRGMRDRHVLADTPAKVMIHELGHRFHLDEARKFDAFDREFDAKVRRLWRDGWAKLLGRYADSNHKEYAAESMVAYTSGDWHLLPDELVEYYQRADKKAEATRALAKRRLEEFEAGTEERLAAIEQRRREREEQLERDRAEERARLERERNE